MGFAYVHLHSLITQVSWTSVVDQRLRLWVSAAGGMGAILVGEIPHAVQCSQKEKKNASVSIPTPPPPPAPPPFPIHNKLRIVAIFDLVFP